MLSLEKIKKSVKRGSQVSILMPLYNKQEYVLASIESVIQQSYTNWELIIIDDCSTDSSWEIVKQLASPQIRVFQNKINTGPYVCLNIALQIARGEYICRLDADDFLHADTLLKSVNYFQSHPEIDIIHYKYHREGFGDMGYGEIGLFYRKKIIDIVGYYDSVRYSADTEFLNRLKKMLPNKITRISEILYFARNCPNSLTTSASTSNGHGIGYQTRQEYMAAVNLWHRSKKELYIPFPIKIRPFVVPKRMCVDYLDAMKNITNFF